MGDSSGIPSVSRDIPNVLGPENDGGVNENQMYVVSGNDHNVVDKPVISGAPSQITRSLEDKIVKDGKLEVMQQFNMSSTALETSGGFISSSLCMCFSN